MCSWSSLCARICQYRLWCKLSIVIKPAKHLQPTLECVSNFALMRAACR